MRAIDAKHSAAGASTIAICLGLLSHCGSGTTTSGNGDAASDDGTVSETDDGGLDAAPDAEVDATTTRESGAGAASDGGDAGDSTAPAAQDAGPDATLDAGDAGDSAAPSSLEAGPDATLDATPADAAPDALDDGGDAEAGPPEAGATPCDVDAQADAQVCSGPATMACCGGFCVDTAADPRNCGSCGNACTTTQFCTGVQCDDAVIAHVCDNPKATVVLDQVGPDDEAGAAIGAALAANCVPATTIVTLDQGVSGVLDPASGRPITGVGNTFVNGGGSYFQRGLSYLEQQGIAPLYPYLNNLNYNIVDRADGGNVVATTPSAITSSHDYFYVQLAVEPQSGTLCFSGVGLGAWGTQAAGFYLSTVIIPNHANYPKAWYVYEWSDTNADSMADTGDTFTLVASGP